MARVVIPGFRKIEVSGGGEGGTTNYNELDNKPSINNVPLVGNLNTANLKLTDATLTEEGVPAEAKTVGTKLEEHSNSLLTLKEQLGNHTVKSDVPENAVFTDTIYDDTDVKEEIAGINSNLGASNAGAHNSIYRGKYLGDALTTEQKEQILAGTFNDLYIGDYWTIGEVAWRIAAFDYWLNNGDVNCTTHHIVIVPDGNLYTTKMNDTNITTGAYVGSKMYTENLAQAKTIITNAFGSENILSHREYLANATKATSDPTYESDGAFYDSTVELMNERMVYGEDVFHNIEVNGAIPKNHTIDKSQLPLFALEPSKICNRATWWLRDVVSSARFADVSNDGLATNSGASGAYGVRPAFGIAG